MGRAERRRRERMERIENKKNEVVLTRQDIAKMKSDISQRVSAFSTESLMTCFALAEHRLHGHGYKRILKTINYVDELMNDILTGDALMEDYTKQLEEETGVVIQCVD